MTELKDRFTLADEVGTRDLWGEAQRRAAAEAPPRAIEWPPGAGRRVAAAAVALAVFATAAVFAWDLSHPDVPLPPPAADPTVDLAAELPEGWSELPAPPEVRSRAATAWTGSQLIVWGGYVFDGGGDKTPTDDGFIFDAASRTWSRVPDGPLSPRSNAAVAWTGEELLIWGGFTGTDCCLPSEMFLDDGAAFDPDTGRWRRLAEGPLEERAPFSVWTGEELIVWGSTGRELYLRDGAAYDPSSDSWRAIAEAPLALTDATTVWTGAEMIVFGSSLDGNNRSETKTAIGVAYDPETDTWRELAPSPLSPQAHTAGWPASGEMIAWDYEHGTAAYDPRTDAWRQLGDVPLRFYECYPRSATVPGAIFGNFCGQLALYSAAQDAWTEITRKDLRGWLIEPVSAGNAFLVLAHSLELSEQPNVTFDTRMLAWVPPSDPVGEVEPSPFVPEAVIDGGVARVALTFPNGATATLVYPAPLDLAGFGVQPDNTYTSGADTSVGGGTALLPIVFIHGPIGAEHDYVAGSEPIRSITGAGGTRLELWEAIPQGASSIEADHWLLHRVDAWTVLIGVAGAATADDAATSLLVHAGTTGMPWIEARNGFELSPFAGELGGTNLTIGDIEPAPNLTSFDDPDFPFIEIHFFECRDGSRDVSADGEHATLCTGGGHVAITLSGERDRVQPLLDGIRIEDFRPA